MFNEMPLDQAMQQYAPQVAQQNLLAQQQPQVMAGTATPQQMQQQNMQTALVDALRQQGGGQSSAPAQAGRVTSAGALGDGMNTNAIGGALGGMFGGGNPAPADLAGTAFI